MQYKIGFMKKLLTLILLISAHFTFGQKLNKVAVTFDHLALSVSDVDRSVNFYSKTLNLKEITNRTGQEGIKWISLGEGKELHLVSGIKGEVTINKAVHLAVKVNDFETFIDNLSSLEISYSDWPGNLNKVNVRADGIKQIYFQDPDGYWIEVNSVSN